jgi:hypothetical protein
VSRRFFPTTRTLLTALSTLVLAAPAHAAGASGGTRSATPSGTAAALAREQYYSSYGKAAEPSDAGPLAQERYYSSYGTRTLSHIGTRQSAGPDGVAPLPLVLTGLGALVVGIGAGSSLHRIQLRRRGARLAA